MTDGGDTSQSDAAVDELGESIKSEGGESLKDIMDKNKDKKEVCFMLGRGCLLVNFQAIVTMKNQRCIVIKT